MLAQACGSCTALRLWKREAGVLQRCTPTYCQGGGGGVLLMACIQLTKRVGWQAPHCRTAATVAANTAGCALLSAALFHYATVRLLSVSMLRIEGLYMPYHDCRVVV